MTFAEWWEVNGLADPAMLGAHHAARVAWNAAVAEEQERCMKVQCRYCREGLTLERRDIGFVHVDKRFIRPGKDDKDGWFPCQSHLLHVANATIRAGEGKV